MKLLKRYLKNQAGQGMSEYLILVMLIAVASIAAARTVGTTVNSKLEQIHRSLNGVTINSVTEGTRGRGGNGTI